MWTGRVDDIYLVTYITSTNRVDIAVCDAGDLTKLTQAGMLINARGPYHTLTIKEIGYAMAHRQITVPGHTQQEEIS